MRSNSRQDVVYVYAGCDTCRKALRWLTAHDIAHVAVPIVERPPSADELLRLIARSGLPAKRWFNTSGQSYRALVARRGKAEVDALGDAEIADLLSKDGKMIKRPVRVRRDEVLVGFREEEWRAV